MIVATFKALIKKLLDQVGLLDMVLESALYKRQYIQAPVINELQSAAARKGMIVQVSRGISNRTIRIQFGDRAIIMAERHLVYCFDMVQGFDYYHGAVVPAHKNGLQIVDYSKPKVHTLIPNNVPFYFTSLAEPQDTTDIYTERAGLREGDVVFDLGAYCGTSTWAFSRAVGAAGHVFAFEPDFENYAALCRNVETHHLTNVTLINKGVWSSSGQVRFNTEGSMGSAVSEVLSRENNPREVEVLSLADAIRDYGVTRLDFVKMDIEGSEVEVLKTSGAMLRGMGARMVVEPHIINGVMATDMVCCVLRDAGYRAEVIPQANLSFPLVYAVPS
jgi:FkbM family methyltransferase